MRTYTKRKNRYERLENGNLRVYFENRPESFIIAPQFEYLLENGLWTCLEPKKGYLYAGRGTRSEDGKIRIEHIHRIIAGAQSTEEHIDHLDFNTLNNLPDNLVITDLTTNLHRHLPWARHTKYAGIAKAPNRTSFYPAFGNGGTIWRTVGGIKSEYLAAQIYNYMVETYGDPSKRVLNPVRRISESQLSKIKIVAVTYERKPTKPKNVYDIFGSVSGNGFGSGKVAA